MSAALAQNSVKPGEPVLVNPLVGSSVAGKLVYFDLIRGEIVLNAEPSGAPITFDLKHCKTVYMPTPRTWIPATAPAGLASGPESPRLADIRQSFAVEFADGDRLQGQTLGLSRSRHGLFLFPLQEGTQFIYVFISHAAIAEHSVGPRLGEVLVKERQLNPEELEAVVAEQRKDRSQPLGEYLKSRAIVTARDLEKALLRQKQIPKMRLGEILVSEKLITPTQLDEALQAQKVSRKKQLGRMLVDQGLVSADQIQQALAKKLGIAFVDLSLFPPDPETLGKVSREILTQFKLLPLHIFNGKIVVAVENPLDSGPLEAVSFQTGLVVEPVMSPPEQIEAALERYLSSDAGPALEYEELEQADALTGQDDELADDASASDNVVVRLVNMLISDAYQKNASDIHIEPRSTREKTLVRVRRDGSLIKFYEIPARLRFAVVSRIKIMAGLDISERRKPQDGKIEFRRFGRLNIELRVATLPTTGGQEDVVMRILSSGKPVPLEKLELTGANLNHIQQLIRHPHGLFFVCGPTGSGKTTTLHSILAHLNTSETKIWTAEDPVEITQRGLRQVQVNPKIGLTFAAAMRAFLRADPDIIMVGEMRDEETVHMGIEASLTGHLVLSTLHTNSAPESITRLLDMGMNPFNFADALLGVLSQRLAKRLCSNCAEPYVPDEQEVTELLDEYCYGVNQSLGRGQEGASDSLRAGILRLWRNQYADAEGRFQLKRAKGCDRCDHTGYRGRVGIHELLTASPEIKRQILDHATVAEITKTALQQGMHTLKQDGIDKVLMGLTDIRQIRRVCA